MHSSQNEDEKYMRRALDQAAEALRRGEVPIGAVVVCGGMVVARGHNMVETLTDATAHAEMQAITSASENLGGKYLGDCTLYVTVEPCVMCAGAAAWSQMGRIVYGAADPRRGFSNFGDGILHPRTEVTAGILEAECSALVSSFFKKLRG
ncbi:MAG: nucleoside deaminase [Rikenellaceae bacterium]|nr:nucleoside deaminase [Rikenellaceae bacterium]